MEEIESAYLDASTGRPARRPVIEIYPFSFIRFFTMNWRSHKFKNIPYVLPFFGPCAQPCTHIRA